MGCTLSSSGHDWIETILHLIMQYYLSRRSLLTKSKPTLKGGKNSHAKVASDRLEEIIIWCIKITMQMSWSGSLVIYKSKPNTVDLP